MRFREKLELNRNKIKRQSGIKSSKREYFADIIGEIFDLIADWFIYFT